jgi:putative membrane protein
MSKILIKFLTVVLTLFVVSNIVPGITIIGLYSAIMVALFLGLLNLIVRPILVFLTLPITFLTLGTFIFIINAGIFMFVGSVVKGFYVDGFLPALVGSIIVSFVSWFVQKII